MAGYALTNTALDLLAQQLVDSTAAVAVGTSDEAVTGGDRSALVSPVYQASVTGDSASVSTLDSTGSLRAAINIVGDIDVPADTELYEIGLLDDTDTLLFRQVTSARVVGVGQSLQLEADLEVVPQEVNI